MQDVAVTIESVLMVGGLPRGLSGFRSCLEGVSESLVFAGTPSEAISLAIKHGPSLAIIAESFPREEVVELLGKFRGLARPVPAVVLSEDPQTEWTVKYVKAGAFDCLTGPSDQCYVDGLMRCVEVIGDGAEVEKFFCDDCPPGVPFVGKSLAAEKLLQTVRLVAFSRCNPVLILGETGVGKELVAQALHCWRSGEHAPMVAVNCAALTATLMESELFGHVKGAFTGADRDKTGLFESAGEGSIFLDEISEMPSELQGKLLRVLQERTFRKVGDTKDIACNATVITASNRDLLAEAKQGRFRQDLYYRLAVFPIHVSPLRSEERREDVELLAEYFVEHRSLLPEGETRNISAAAMRELARHDWPGNVRELRNVMARATLLARGPRITPESIIFDESLSACPACSSGPREEAGEASKAGDFSLETAEREFIRRALKETGWQRTRAAKLLGITRATLHAKIKRYGIEAT